MGHNIQPRLGLGLHISLRIYNKQEEQRLCPRRSPVPVLTGLGWVSWLRLHNTSQTWEVLLGTGMTRVRGNLSYEFKCLCVGLNVFNLIVFHLTKRLCRDLKGYYHGSHYFYSEFSRGPLLLFCPSLWRHLTFPLRAATSVQSNLHKTVIAHHLFYLRQHGVFIHDCSSSVAITLNPLFSPKYIKDVTLGFVRGIRLFQTVKGCIILSWDGGF